MQTRGEVSPDSSSLIMTMNQIRLDTKARWADPSSLDDRLQLV
jgi:hypothetical protein